MPPTLSPPLTLSTPSNQTGLIAILTAFSLSLTLLALSLRLYIQHTARPPLTPLFLFLLCAAAGSASAGVTLAGVRGGLGVSLSDLLQDAVSEDGGGKGGDSGEGKSTLAKLETLGKAAVLLYLLALAASKTCCAAVLHDLTPFQTQKKLARGIALVAVLWCAVSLFVVGFGCAALDGECAGFEARWIGVSVVDVAVEAALVGASAYMVWGRSMCGRAKGRVVGAFGGRVVNIALTLARLVFITTGAETDAIYIARLHAATQLAIGYTVVSCVIPYLRPLMQSYEADETGYGREEASFRFSERSTRGSDGSVGGGEAKGKGKEKEVGGLELGDVGSLLAPVRPVLARLRSGEKVERVRGPAGR